MLVCLTKRGIKSHKRLVSFWETAYFPREKRPNGVRVRSETEIRALFRRGRGETQFRRKFFCLLFFQEK